jgi:integrase
MTHRAEPLTHAPHGGRPRTGSIDWADAEKTIPLGVRVKEANGKRRFIRFDKGTTREEALALAPILAERAGHAVEENTRETVAEYAKRWCTWRESRGLGCVAGDRTTLALHVLPHIAALEIRAVTRNDLKRLVSALDTKARVGFYRTAEGKRQRFGFKSAICAWSVTRALFRDAQRAKAIELCVRDDNPADGVAAPDTGAKKAKTYLWPSEFAALVASERVPVRWRRLFALAIGTYARAGELAALEWGDVDLDHGAIHIHRSTDRTRAHRKGTKTEAARRIPIEPTLLPLLRALHAEAKGRGPVVRMPSTGKQSARLRIYLARVGITRADLFVSDATRKAMTFHDLRATGITWCAVRGDDPLKIMQRAGHADFVTTQIYLREAENLGSGFGAVFPPLPADVLASATSAREARKARGVLVSVLAFGVGHLPTAGKNKPDSVGATGFEPATP